MEMLERERSIQMARAGSVPPGMMPGGGLSQLEAMEMQRRMQMMAAGFPGGINSPQAASYAAAMAQQQAQQQQQDMMMHFMGAGGAGPSPAQQQAAALAHLQQSDPALFRAYMQSGAFGPSPFPGGPGGMPSAELMHMMGGGMPPSFEQQQFMAQQQVRSPLIAWLIGRLFLYSFIHFFSRLIAWWRRFLLIDQWECSSDLSLPFFLHYRNFPFLIRLPNLIVFSSYSFSTTHLII